MNHLFFTPFALLVATVLVQCAVSFVGNDRALVKSLQVSSKVHPLSARALKPGASRNPLLLMNFGASTAQTGWFQKKIQITAPGRGCHLVTRDIVEGAPEIRDFEIGMVNLFIQHTSASLTINENCDPDVRTDMEKALNRIVPEVWNQDGTFDHTMEGPDDMPAHVKTTLIGPSLTIPISNGGLALGTWQGIYLNEHRNMGGYGGRHTRTIVITIQGQKRA
ncbi:unnamed protein product [Heterosigma akashiwo]